MIRIPVKPLQQETPNDCSITCLRMILDYYGLKISRADVYDFIRVTADGGSFLSEMGRFANSQGLATDLFAYNLYLTDPKDARLSKAKLLEKLERELKNSERDKYYDLMLESTINGIKNGVNYIIQKPDIEVMKKYLVKGIPLTVRINYAALVGEKGDPFDSHDLVLSGMSAREVFTIDPYDGSQKPFSHQDLMFAINQSKVISASAYLLAIKPSKS